MPYHHWGDKWGHWNELHSAIENVERIYRIFRIGSHGKEKFGTYRDYPYFWEGGLHELIWPGYVRIMNRVVYYIDKRVIRPFTRYSGIHKVGVMIQKIGYNIAFQYACKKHPNVIDELVSDAYFPELIKPGIFGPISGTEIHNKYWETVR